MEDKVTPLKASIAWKPAGDRSLPGSRLRAYLPAEHMRQAGWRTEVFDEGRADSYDLVIFQKIYQRDTIELARRLKQRGTKLVFDLCDNHFYKADDSPKTEDRCNRLQEMIDLVDAVSASTWEISRLIEHENVVVIDDPIDYPARSRWLEMRLGAMRLFSLKRNRRVRFVWHGTAGQTNPPTGLIDIQRVLPHLEHLNRSVPVALTVISNSRRVFEQHVKSTTFPTKYIDWKLSTFPYHLKQNDICIIPITMNAFTVCKTNNRLVSSLLFGLPVVADPITSYQEFDDCVLFGNWTENLRRYALDPGLRREHVEKAHRYIHSKYTSARVVSQWSDLFNEVLSSEPAKRRVSL
jgi:hypothetical protein